MEWGISRNAAQVHALLLSSSLIDWQLVRRGISGDGRRDAFEAEADVWEMARRIVLRRRQRELEPLVALLGQLVAFKQPPRIAARRRSASGES